MQLLDYFRESFSEVVGIYYDGDKIYLTRLTDKAESVDANFEMNLNDKSGEIEQLAEKISMLCAQRGWKTSNMGLCLRDGTATTLLTDFKNVPANEIESAVKIWAVAHVGRDASYTSINVDDDIWMESLPRDIVDEYVTAWNKNSMTLSALTDIPPNFIAQNSFDKANFVAEVIKQNRQPNLLSARASAWNIKKIIAVVAIIFILILSGVSAKIFYDYYRASTDFETAQTNLNAEENLIALKNSIDIDIAEMKRLNEMAALHKNSAQKLNALIRLGKIADGNVILNRIRIADNLLELEGFTEKSDALKIYISRLKSAELQNVKLENSSTEDGQINFRVRANFNE